MPTLQNSRDARPLPSLWRRSLPPTGNTTPPTRLSESRVKRRYEEILGLLRSRYGTTSVDQQDVIRAEIEAATAEGDVVRRQGEQKSAAARLNALIGRPSLAPLAAPTGFRTVKVISLAQVQALARSANPLLALAGAQTNSAAQTKSLTDLNYYPDLTLGAKYVQ